MTVRASPFDPSSAPRQRVGAPSPAASDRELVEVMGRAARLPNGLALLRAAPLESAAVLLGVAPPAIERCRVALLAPGALDAATARLAGLAAGDPAAARPPRPPAPGDPAQLLEAARRRADGLGLLLSASPEAAAITFGVHPDLVHGAREVAARGSGYPHL